MMVGTGRFELEAPAGVNLLPKSRTPVRDQDEMVGTGRFELPTPRTPSECSTRLSHVPTQEESTAELHLGFSSEPDDYNIRDARSAHCRVAVQPENVTST